MRTFAAIVAASALILITGCSGEQKTDSLSSSGGSKSPAASSASSLAGSYKGKIVPTGSKDDPAAKMAEGLAEMFSPELEITADNKFTLSVMGMPISGSVNQSGTDITLTPEKVMGMTPEEAKKLNASSPGSPEPDMKPMKGTVAKDGTIMVKDE